jgi:protection-of-telomeres protein 1
MPIRVPRRSINDPPPDSDDENDALPVKGKFLPESAMSRHEELSDNNRNSINGVIVKSNGKVESKHLSMAQAKKELDKAIESLPVTNKGFSCCIQQYGVKVSEINDDLADAGEGVRWQRMYGLFGTIIT